MMKDFKTVWDNLFIIRISMMTQFQGKPITVTYNQELMIGDSELVWGSKIIIDNILLWCDKEELVLVLFTCICEVFQKYQVSFRLDKCDFFKESGMCWT